MGYEADFPYVSQWAEGKFNSAILKGMDPCTDPQWKEITGFNDKEYYRFWSWKMCGIAAFRSYLLARNQGTTPSSFELLQLAVQCGAYVEKENGSVLGLIYKPFCEMVSERFGIKARVETELDRDKLKTFLENGCPVITSVSNTISTLGEAGKKGGHLVICYRIQEGKIYFNDPASINPAPYRSYMPLNNFYNYCSGRGIYLPAL